MHGSESRRHGKQSQTHRILAFVLRAGSLLLLAVLARLAADWRDKLRMAERIEAAREIQQLLLTGAAGSADGFEIDTRYFPAEETGVDFYQVFVQMGGGCLVAIGDVSGKGLKAAMVVSLLTGALRNRKSQQPAEILAKLNAVLSGALNGGFVTAAITAIGPDGNIEYAGEGSS